MASSLKTSDKSSMDYQDKIQLIERLKNFVSPFDGLGVFFNFSSESEFVLEFLTEETLPLDLSGELFREKYRAELPYASITYNHWGNEILVYHDQVMTYTFNMTIQQLEYFSHRIERPPSTPEQIRKEMDLLLKRLKNS